MESTQAKGVVLKAEIKKERVPHYPYHLVTDTYSQDQDYYFLAYVDYYHDDTVVSVTPFLSDMTKQTTSTINVNNILTKKAVSALAILSLKYKPLSSGVQILQAEFVLGHRSGQVAVIQYKERDCKIVARLNKTLKGEGFFSKTSSLLFGEEDSYSPHIKEPIRAIKTRTVQSDLKFSYQVGNNILFMKSVSEINERSFFECFQNNGAEAFAFHYDLNQPAEKGALKMFGSQQYYGLKDHKMKIGMLKFNAEVSSYELMPDKRQEIAVSLSAKEMVLLIDVGRLSLNRKIITETGVRRLYYFAHKKEDFLAAMFYQNYLVLYQLNSNRYCKMTGHRSFIANVGYLPSEEMVVTAGMDHRISLIKLPAIKEEHWKKVKAEGGKILMEEGSCSGMRFPDIYSLGQYNNVRSNLHSYGFADFFMLNNHFCLPTYDAKLMVYKYA